MDQFDQLLTCAICLDRYRNPKLLPCQHSFCMEPCMEGLVDYIKKQVKCPECRQECRVPYQGVQAFPTNVTLQRFLELHIDLTGEVPDPTANQIMERCQVCSEKSYCVNCTHCDKKVCTECKDAHMDVLKREISRISNQVRRVLHRLEDALTLGEKNAMHLQQNSLSVIEEIDDIYRRLSKALKDRAEHLKQEVERYLQTEVRNLSQFKHNIDQELTNIQSNCDLVDKYMAAESSSTVWDDCELMDTKDIFLKTMEFIRNFEYEPGDYARRVRFNVSTDPNTLAVTLATYGDLHLPPSNLSSGGSSGLNGGSSHGGHAQSQSSTSGLMRSKSDHRLTTQFRGQDYDGDTGGGRTSPVFGRKFGERKEGRGGGSSGYGEDSGALEAPERKSRFRSRFVRHLDTSFDEPADGGRGVRFTDEAAKKERERVLDTEDVTRGPLSGITKLLDCPRVIQRVQETDMGPRVPKPAPVVTPPTPAPTPVAPAPTPAPTAPWRAASRQLSEDDEISRQKKANKEPAAATTAATPPTPKTATATPVPPKRTPSNEPRSPSDRNFGGSRTSSENSAIPAETVAPPEPAPARKLSPERFPKKTRSESSDSGTSETSSGSTSSRTEEVKQRFLSKAGGGSAQDTAQAQQQAPAPKPRFQSRFLPGRTATPTTTLESKEESSSSEEEEEEEEESESEEEEPPKTLTPDPPRSRMEKTDIGPLLARSSNARDTSRDYGKKDPPVPTVSSYRRTRDVGSRVTSPPERELYAGSSTRSTSAVTAPSTNSSPYTSRYSSTQYGGGGASDHRYDSSATSGLTRSRTGTSLYSSSPPRDTQTSVPSSRYSSEERVSKVKGSGGQGVRSDRERRRERLAKSKSSAEVLAAGGFCGSEDEGHRSSAGRGSGAAATAAPVKTSRRKSTSTAAGEIVPSNDDSASLSSWARYLKNKYGKGQGSSTSKRGSFESSSDLESSVERPKPSGVTSTAPGGNHYMNKSRLQFKCGSRGSDPGFFTWPRDVSVGTDGSIVVTDSSNHRIQVFTEGGAFVKEFGAYGNGEGEFDCPAGVVVNRIGQYIISDRYNHRIVVLDPSGRFLRAFGSQGSSDGRFNYPWGVCCDPLGFIYVVDRENSRVQVFQSDGTFVGKFGSLGNKAGEFNHPHYIAVTSTNRVIVSDTNNHRIQIFDVNGKYLSTFGSEGCEAGQFKFPRGISLDETFGNIIVGDSGNNRIQIFTPDGVFLHSFGSWGCGDSEFKGMEGIAVTGNGNILVVDREQHCVKCF